MNIKAKNTFFIAVMAVSFFGTFLFASDSRAADEEGSCNCYCKPASNNLEGDPSSRIASSLGVSDCKQWCSDIGASYYVDRKSVIQIIYTINDGNGIACNTDKDCCVGNNNTCLLKPTDSANQICGGGFKVQDCKANPACASVSEPKTNTNNTQTKPTATTNPTSTSSNGTSFTNPLAFSTVEGFLGGIMSAIQKIIVVLALVTITIGSVFILASAGNSGMVEKGKEAITMALVGLAIGIAAPSLLKELANIIGWGGATPAALSLSDIALRVLNFLLGTMGILALIMLVFGAIMYLTSAGDEDRIDKGKEIFKYSLIGVLMAMASMVLVKQIALFFV